MNTKACLLDLKNRGLVVNIRDLSLLANYIDYCDSVDNCKWNEAPLPFVCSEFTEEFRKYLYSVAKDGIRIDKILTAQMIDEIIELCPKLLIGCIDYGSMVAYSRYEKCDGLLYIIPSYYEAPILDNVNKMVVVDLSEVFMIYLCYPTQYDSTTMKHAKYIYCCGAHTLPDFQGTVISGEGKPFETFERLWLQSRYKKSVNKR